MKWTHDVSAMPLDFYTTTRYRINSCNDVTCLLLSVVLMLIYKGNWNLRVCGVRLKKIFAFETELYSKISIWKNLKLIWHSFQTFLFFIFVSTQKGNDIPEDLFVSPHSHKLLTEFNFIRFCRHFNIKK